MKIPKSCWYCKGIDTLIGDKRGAVCSKCGATWSPLVKLGPEVLENHRGAQNGGARGAPGPGALAHSEQS